MGKKKDEAFLMYSNKWLQGTAALSAEAKGVYIDFLCHQHQTGFLPNDPKKLARLAAMSMPEFEPIWAELNVKFDQNGDRITNRKLTNVVTERLTKSFTNTVTGTLASVARKFNDPPEIRKMILETFDITCFEMADLGKKERERLTKRLTQWYENAKESIISYICINNTNVDNINTSSIIEPVKEKKRQNFPNHESIGKIELTETQIGSIVQLFKITKQTDISTDQILGLWQVFQIQNFTGTKFYSDNSAIFSHFMNWTKTQNIQKNGQAANFNGSKSNRERQNDATEAVVTDLTSTLELMRGR